MIKRNPLISSVKYLAQSKFARNVAIVATGTAGAQAITLGFSPIITRLYGPDAFGVLGVFVAILGVLAPLAALSYPISIVLPKREDEAITLAKLSLKIAIFMSLLTGCVLALFKQPLINSFNLQAVEPFIFLLPLAMLFSAMMAIMTQWVIRKKMFRLKAKVAVLQSLWLNLAQVAMGMLAPVSLVLVALTTLASIMHAFMLWIGARRRPGGSLSASGNGQAEGYMGAEKRLAWQHRDFAYYRTPQIVLNAASQSMPVIMLASFFGPATAGFYALGKMVLGAPTTLIGQSVASVFYPRINEAVHNGEDAFKLLVKATSYLAVLGILPFGIIIILGPWLFTFVFGEEWRTAGVYAQWLAIWSYFGFINRPSVGAIPVFSLQGLFLIYEVVSIVFRAASLVWAFYYFNSALAAVAAFSVVSVVLNVFLIVATLFSAYKLQFGRRNE